MKFSQVLFQSLTARKVLETVHGDQRQGERGPIWWWKYCGVLIFKPGSLENIYVWLSRIHALEPWNLLNVTSFTRVGYKTAFTWIATVKPFLSRWGRGLFGTWLGRERDDSRCLVFIAFRGQISLIAMFKNKFWSWNWKVQWLLISIVWTPNSYPFAYHPL